MGARTVSPSKTEIHRKLEPERPAPAPPPMLGNRIAQYVTSLAVPVVLAAFWWTYHVVLPSDDVSSMRTLRKERGSFSGTVVFAQKFVDDYNRANGETQVQLEKTYLYRRLLQTGIVRRSE